MPMTIASPDRIESLARLLADRYVDAVGAEQDLLDWSDAADGDELTVLSHACRLEARYGDRMRAAAIDAAALLAGAGRGQVARAILRDMKLRAARVSRTAVSA